ncbi:hypothetical protein AGMMS50212_04120 [Spirochaetia bacterium]|nr:hypothetical protein AGMMS50212_04120 [Spirochaetia bacterium]
MRITDSGFIIINKGDDYENILDAIIESGYAEEFCLSNDFSPDFVADLMNAGFLVMSIAAEDEQGLFYILMPKHHLVRTVLFFDRLHIGRTASRFMQRYELKTDTDFELIVKRCVQKHGDDWLTPPLLESIYEIKKNNDASVKPFSFGLYSQGELKAGEFGIVSGRVYTSYSGYYDESSAGRVQMIKTAQYLEAAGFDFWDLGMPLDYKFTLGAHNIGIKEFTELFRSAKH